MIKMWVSSLKTNI